MLIDESVYVRISLSQLVFVRAAIKQQLKNCKNEEFQNALHAFLSTLEITLDSKDFETLFAKPF